MEEMLGTVPKLVSSLSDTDLAAQLAATAITTTDLVYKSSALEIELGGDGPDKHKVGILYKRERESVRGSECPEAMYHLALVSILQFRKKKK